MISIALYVFFIRFILTRYKMIIHEFRRKEIADFSLSLPKKQSILQSTKMIDVAVSEVDNDFSLLLNNKFVVN